MWLETYTCDLYSLCQVRSSTRLPICSGNSLYTCKQFKPSFDLHSIDVSMVGVVWNGLSESGRIAALAGCFEIPVSPHIYCSHLCTFMSARLCASVLNLKIMETDVDAVPWKNDIVTEVPDVRDGHLTIPNGPGLGTNL